MYTYRMDAFMYSILLELFLQKLFYQILGTLFAHLFKLNTNTSTVPNAVKFYSNCCDRNSSKEMPFHYRPMRLLVTKQIVNNINNDILLGFGTCDPAQKTHNSEVTEATQKLFTIIIPKFVAEPRQLLSTDGSLVKEIHKEGN